MPKPIAKKRHMKKVLDRWENEGGTVPEGIAISPRNVLPDPQPDNDDQTPIDHDGDTPESKMSG